MMADEVRSPIPAEPTRDAERVETPPPALPWSRKLAALLIALVADAPPVCLLSEAFPVVCDVAVAGLLWLVLGRSWLLATALVIECVPGLDLAPTWTAYVLFQVVFARNAKPVDTGHIVDPSRPRQS